jgi:multicomponent Na+:H+ antiporter subunit E
LKATSDVEITVIANLISLTPGTLTLDVSDDRQVLYIHSIYVDDIDALTDSVTNGVERRTLELLR